MKRIREKLHSTRGASILFAALVFILCAFAGAAALTAAAANAGRFSHAERDQQKYLSVAAAADLFREEVGPQRLEFTQALTETRTWEYDADNNLKYNDPTYALGSVTWRWFDGEKWHGTDATDPGITPDLGDDKTAALLKSVAVDYCQELFEAQVIPADWYTKTGTTRPTPSAYTPRTLTVTGPAALGLDTVYVTVSMDNAYTMIMTLGAAEDGAGMDGGKLPPLAYKMTLRLPAKTSQTVDANTSTTGEDKTGETVTTTTLTFTVEWVGENAAIMQDQEGQ